MIGIFFANGFEEVEALAQVDILRRAGLDTVMISVNNLDKETGSHGIEVVMDQKLEDTNFEDLDAIVMPGGNPGYGNLGKCELLKEKTRMFIVNEKKLVAAICGAPSVLGEWGVLDGRRACVYPGMEKLLTGAEVSFDKVVTDRNLITSRGLGTAIDFGLAIVEYYKGKEKAEDIAGKIVYI